MLLNGRNFSLQLDLHSINKPRCGDIMSHLVISKKNEVYLNVEAEPHVYYELADQFTFEVPACSFSCIQK